jgi:hypothetical protein
VALLVPAVSGSRFLGYCGFLVFETCVGVYFPAMSTMKSKIVPEAQRVGIYNIFRIPLNLIVLSVLLTKITTEAAFVLCAAMLALAAVLMKKLAAELTNHKQPSQAEDAALMMAADSI